MAWTASWTTLRQATAPGSTGAQRHWQDLSLEGKAFKNSRNKGPSSGSADRLMLHDHFSVIHRQQLVLALDAFDGVWRIGRIGRNSLLRTLGESVPERPKRQTQLQECQTHPETYVTPSESCLKPSAKHPATSEKRLVVSDTQYTVSWYSQWRVFQLRCHSFWFGKY